MKREEIIREKAADILKIDNIETVAADQDLKEYGMDSLNAIELVVSLELEFGIEFAEEDLLVDNLCTIQKLVEVVEKNL